MSTSSELTPAEALNLALDLHKAGGIEDAETLYRRILWRLRSQMLSTTQWYSAIRPGVTRSLFR